ncbi:SLC13 family permease [Microvirga sp. W0021]|uniref:SLC13 family permease n=1 Tax=Hohaiivirga grylli TaxID=3133970 RepID=A0ABV0BKP5_9HYPH
MVETIPMTRELAIVLLLLCAAIIMFARNKPRMDVVALIMIAALPLFGILTIDEALAGFSDKNVILIALLFVIGDGLVRTGIAQRVGDWLVAKAGRQETRLIPLLMLLVAGFGCFMSSTGVVAIFIPIVLRMCQNANIAASRLMMPLAFAALMSGMMTLVATPPNLIVHGELVRRGLEGFSFFSFTPFGLPILIIAILYMLATRNLFGKRATSSSQPQRPHLASWVEEYALNNREARLRVLPKSTLIGKTLEELDLRATAGINILSIERSRTFGRKLVIPRRDTQLNEGDIILLDVTNIPSNAEELCEIHGLQIMPLSGTYFTDRSQEIGMAEVMIPAASQLIDKTVVEAQFRTEYNLAVVGLKRGQTAFEGSISNERFQIGDTLLVIGPWRYINRLKDEFQNLLLLNLPEEVDQVIPIPARAPHALIVLGLVIFLLITNVIPNVLAALIGCLLLGLFRCITMDAAYRSIHWPSLILIVGMLPFALALQKTGGVTIAANALLEIVGDSSPRIVLIGLFAATAILGLFISNTATAVLMAPVALALADGLSASPYPFAMTVALAASAAFMTPVSSPVNTLVIGPGNYTFFDFVKIGVPMTLATMIITVFLVPILLPF